jgi:hypothetical protein
MMVGGMIVMVVQDHLCDRSSHKSVSVGPRLSGFAGVHHHDGRGREEEEEDEDEDCQKFHMQRVSVRPSAGCARGIRRGGGADPEHLQNLRNPHLLRPKGAA